MLIEIALSPLGQIMLKTIPFILAVMLVLTLFTDYVNYRKGVRG